MDQMKVIIRTISPVVLPAMTNSTTMLETQDYISGSILRGVLAGQYIKARGLGRNAHEDEEFRQTFFGSLCFSDAYIAVNGYRAVKIPASLQQNKQGTEIRDFLRAGKTGETQGNIGFKACRGIGIVDGEQTLHKISVRKTITMHMSRENDSERISGRSEDGNIYNYEAIDAGQEFVGYIFGEAAALKSFREALDLDSGSMIGYIGRSKYTQYGKCRITIEQPERLSDIGIPKGKAVCLRLETAFLPVMTDGCSLGNSAVQMLQSIVDYMNREYDHSGMFAIPDDKIFASMVHIDNFVGVWGMKRPQLTGLDAGSVFVMEKKESWTEADMKQLQKLMYSGCMSFRREEGFGQMRLWDSSDLKLGETVKPQIDTPDTLDIKVKSIARKVLIRWMHTRMHMFASQDVEKLSCQNSLKDMTHTFSRLAGIIDNKIEIGTAHRSFCQMLAQVELRAGTPMEQHLKNLRLDEISLKDILTDQASMPYNVPQRSLKEGYDLASEIGAEAAAELQDDRLFFEYWHSFFQHAKKQAANSKEAD